jgi:hypothetical protein
MLVNYMGATPAWAQRARRFETLVEITDAGALVTSSVYKQAAAAFGQDPRPEAVVIGRRTRASTQVIKLTPQYTVVGYKYAFTVVEQGGTSTDISYTVLSGDDAAAIATAIAALLDALGSVVATATSTVITATTTAGQLANYKNLPNPSKMLVQDAATDPGIAADLTEIESEATEAKLSYYGVAVDHACKAINAEVAAWVETRSLFFVPRLSDSACVDSGSTTDGMATLKASAYKKTMGPIFAMRATNDYRDAAFLGVILTRTPGAYTGAFKLLVGIDPDPLLPSQSSALEAKNGTSYHEISGVNVTFETKTCVGEFADIPIFAEFLSARIQERVFGRFVTTDKTDYSDLGASMVKQLVQSELNDNVSSPDRPRGSTRIPRRRARSQGCHDRSRGSRYATSHGGQVRREALRIDPWCRDRRQSHRLGSRNPAPPR